MLFLVTILKVHFAKMQGLRERPPRVWFDNACICAFKNRLSRSDET